MASKILAKIFLQECDHQGMKPIHLASVCGNDQAVKLLLEQTPTELLAKNRWKENALHMAAAEGHEQVVFRLLEKAEKIPTDLKVLLSTENQNGATPLHHAVYGGSINIVYKLVEKCRDYPKMLNATQRNLMTPLHLACIVGKLDIVKHLVENGAKLMNNGKVEGANKEAQNKKGYTALLSAAKYGKYDAVLLLLEHKVNIKVRANDHCNIIHVCAERNNLEVLKKLREKNILLESMVNIPDLDRNTPLHIAAKNGYLEFTEKQRKPNSIRLLCSKWSEKGAEILIDSGAPVNMLKFNNYANSGMAPLHWACKGGHVDMVKLLLDKGAEATEIEDGRNALDVAADNRNNDCAMEIINRKDWMEVLKFKTKSGGDEEKTTTMRRLIMNLPIVAKQVFNKCCKQEIKIDSERRTSSNYDSEIAPIRSNGTCEVISEAQQEWGDSCDFKHGEWIAGYIAIGAAILNLIKEFVQMYGGQRAYFRDPTNWIELSLYGSAIAAACPFTEYTQTYGILEGWQWQLGSITIFLSWMELLLFVENIPKFKLGIYVIMFTNILKTFLKFSIVLFVFVCAFGFSFHVLFQNQIAFTNLWKSIVRTLVIMIGEIDFDSMFNAEQTSPAYSDQVYYEVVSYIVFVASLIIMSIIVMNMLVGLAVDDIKEVQKKAELESRARHTKLVLETQSKLPKQWIKRFIPNEGKIEVKHNEQKELTQIVEKTSNDAVKSQMHNLRLRIYDVNKRAQRIESMMKLNIGNNTYESDDDNDDLDL
uniref:transient receptor potential cation channel subfamily A member 1 homolog n=1 Tax=Styela clava TaxID=7725 RepID=UPI0019399341|nr:transient receptor potential cation channel subfamily A member 1 homolog [Styela clava]